MIIEPAGKKDAAGDSKPQAAASGATVVSIDAAGKVKVDGMSVTVERLPEALGNRRLASKVRIVPDANAPAAEVAKVREAVAGAHVEIEGEEGAQSAGPPGLSDVHADEQLMKRLKELWEKKVAPHDKSLREAAQAHYEVIESMRREQQRLIDEADRIQRTIDELQKQYQEMTTPRPEPSK
jgi:hypothetical protein